MEYEGAMCSVVLLRRPDHRWPLLLAANRDEIDARPWRPPARHWPDRPEVIAGLDEAAGGSWMGLNEDGVVACVLNRRGSLGPQAGKRSRGELVLDALDHARAADAALAFADLDPRAWRSFNLVLADSEQAFWLRHSGSEEEGIEVHPIRPGLAMLTAGDLDDAGSPRISHFRPFFAAAEPPDPDRGPAGWASWRKLLAARVGSAPGEGMNVSGPGGFATVSSSLLALPSRPQSLAEPPRPPIWLFAPGAPDEADYADVAL